jgi:hypothetical protein
MHGILEKNFAGTSIMLLFSTEEKEEGKQVAEKPHMICRLIDCLVGSAVFVTVDK